MVVVAAHTYTHAHDTHVHFNVGFLRVHISVVARVTLRVSRVVTVRDAVHQMPVQLVRIPEDFRRDDRSVTPESLEAQPPKGKFYARPPATTRRPAFGRTLGFTESRERRVSPSRSSLRVGHLTKPSRRSSVCIFRARLLKSPRARRCGRVSIKHRG